MKSFRRMAVLAAASLAFGILINQFLDDGIPWRLLVPALPGHRAAARAGTMDVETAFALSRQEQVAFLDIRTPSEFSVDRIPGATSAPFTAFFRRPSDFMPVDRTGRVVVYDFEPGSKKARLVTQWLVREGFSRVTMLYPGFSGWLETGKPAEKGKRP
jgi:rhodanese-related sulfurtransferase